VTPENLNRLEEPAKAGVISFKVFMRQSVRSPWLHDGYLFEAFRKIGRIGFSVGVHVENHWLIDYPRRNLRSQGRKNATAHLESRPSISEAEAIQRAIFYARLTGVKKLHIHHVSSKEGVELI
jgi:allantoinase